MKYDKALLAENGGEINLIKHWAASRMKYVKRRGTKFDEIKEQFLQDILTTVVIMEILYEFIINWDQTAISFVHHRRWSGSGTRRVIIAGLGGQKAGICCFGWWDFLPPQLICTGKTPTCHPGNVAFHPDWHITHSRNHWSNKQTVNEYILNIIVPYTRERIDCSSTQKALVLFDVFRGQTCQSMLHLLQSNNIEFVS